MCKYTIQQLNSWVSEHPLTNLKLFLFSNSLELSVLHTATVYLQLGLSVLALQLGEGRGRGGKGERKGIGGSGVLEGKEGLGWRGQGLHQEFCLMSGNGLSTLFSSVQCPLMLPLHGILQLSQASLWSSVPNWPPPTNGRVQDLPP